MINHRANDTIQWSLAIPAIVSVHSTTPPRQYLYTVHHICTFYLRIKIQLPDHVRKRPDQWPVHQSSSRRREICFLNFASHILTRTITVDYLHWTPWTGLPVHLYRWISIHQCPVHCQEVRHSWGHFRAKQLLLLLWWRGPKLPAVQPGNGQFLDSGRQKLYLIPPLNRLCALHRGALEISQSVTRSFTEPASLRELRVTRQSDCILFVRDEMCLKNVVLLDTCL